MSLLNPNWRKLVLDALAEMPVLSYAAMAAGIDRSTLFRERQKDRAFAAEVEQAMEAGIDRAEQEAFRRAVIGWEEPVVDKGRLAYRYERVVDDQGQVSFTPLLDAQGQPLPLTIRKHSDTLLVTVLRARRREYGTERTEITSPDGSMSPTDEVGRAARVAQLMALAARRKAAAGDDTGGFA